jgi:hypothetical protein
MPQQAQRRSESLWLLSVRNAALEQSVWSAPLPGRFMSGKGPVGIILEAGGPGLTDTEYFATHRHSIPAPSSP